jgi:hypothetical protein
LTRSRKKATYVIFPLQSLVIKNTNASFNDAPWSLAQWLLLLLCFLCKGFLLLWIFLLVC